MSYIAHQSFNHYLDLKTHHYRLEAKQTLKFGETY